MVPFIDIHSHKPSGLGVFSVLNAEPQEYILFEDKSYQMVSVGLHPWKIDQSTDLEMLHSFLSYYAGYRNVIALGETGLDKAANVPLEIQISVFEIHIRVAEKFQKPLILHCVRAYQELLALRKQFAAVQPWIFHGFSGSAQLAMQCMKQNCILSFGKAIMQQNTRAIHSLLHCEAGSFFLESDGGDVDIRSIYQQAAFLKNISVDALKEHTFALFKNTFPNAYL